MDVLVSGRRSQGANDRLHAQCQARQACGQTFLSKMIQSEHAAVPYVMTVDKNPAYPIAFDQEQDHSLIPKGCRLRQIRYLNNIVEQDHRFIKHVVNPGMGFGSFWTAKNTLAGFEAMNTIRKGQVCGMPKGEMLGQARFVSSVFRLV